MRFVGSHVPNPALGCLLRGGPAVFLIIIAVVIPVVAPTRGRVAPAEVPRGRLDVLRHLDVLRKATGDDCRWMRRLQHESVGSRDVSVAHR